MTRTFALLLVLLAAAGQAGAKNVDLVTLPKRDSVQLTIYNSEDLTLVKETRHVTLKRGPNQLQFSWANTLIDPTSVEFRPLERVGDIEVADTVFPGQKPQHLIWNIESKFEGQVKVEVSYFTSGLTWTMDYVALCDPGETAMDFTGHVRVYNRSGEEYEDAEVRLIVGRVNLVEKIAALARRQGIPVPQPGTARFKELRKRAGRKAFGKAEAEMALDSAAPGEKKGVVKEGLSEYFMFSIEGTETIRNGWSKRMEAVRADGSGFDILYRMRAHQYGPRPVRFFLWRNDDEHNLGESPLPDGRVRIFRRNGQDGMSFLGEQIIRYVPIKALIEVNLGTDDLVVYETRKVKTERSNFAFNRHNQVTGWDEQTRWLDTIRNYRKKPIRFELRRVWRGHVDYSSELRTKRFDYHTIEASFDVGARGEFFYPCVVVTHHGSNKRQERVELK